MENVSLTDYPKCLWVNNIVKITFSACFHYFIKSKIDFSKVNNSMFWLIKEEFYDAFCVNIFLQAQKIIRKWTTKF